LSNCRDKTSGAIDTIRLAKEKISAVVRNTGNVHFKIASISLKADPQRAEVFSKEIAGDISQPCCRDIEVSILQKHAKTVICEIEAKTDISI